MHTRLWLASQCDAGAFRNPPLDAGMWHGRGVARPRFHRAPVRKASPASSSASALPPVFTVADDGTVRVHRSDGAVVSTAEAEALIASHAAEVRARLEAFVVERRKEHQRCLAEHRLLRRTPLDPGQLLARFDAPRPAEPLPAPHSGMLDWLLRRSERATLGHFRELWTYRQTLATWERARSEHALKTADRRAEIKRLLAGDPDAIRSTLEQQLQRLRWALPVKIKVSSVRKGAVTLNVAFPKAAAFPPALPSVAGDGRSAGPAQRPREELEAEAERYRLSASVRLAAECFAQVPSVQAVHIAHGSRFVSRGASAAYERHRWLAADMRLADELDPKPLHDQLVGMLQSG